MTKQDGSVARTPHLHIESVMRGEVNVPTAKDKDQRRHDQRRKESRYEREEARYEREESR